jgi:hypothetical protein
MAKFGVKSVTNSAAGGTQDKRTLNLTYRYRSSQRLWHDKVASRLGHKRTAL